MKDHIPRWSALTVLMLVVGLIAGFAAVDKAQAQCTNTITADVVALDQNYFVNRLGALNNLGMIYALKRDVYTNSFAADGTFTGQSCAVANCAALAAGADPNAAAQHLFTLRPDKRPQPIALRVPKGYCLTINFTNLLSKTRFGATEQNVTRRASAHVTGLPLVGGIASDGSYVGANNTLASMPLPGGTAEYTYYAVDENVYMITSMANTTGSQGSGGSLTFGLYGAVIVEPGNGTAAGASEFYRSHVTNEDMMLASAERNANQTVKLDNDGKPIVKRTPATPADPTATPPVAGKGDQPIIDYDAIYPNVDPFITENKAGIPVLKMVCDATTVARATAAGVPADKRCVAGQLVHSDIHAIITGPSADDKQCAVTKVPCTVTTDCKGGTKDTCTVARLGYTFAAGTTYPSTATNPRQDLPFREAASIFGDEQFNIQAFPFFFENPVLKHTFNITKDGFVINYGGGAIGPEIVANRLGVGPMWDCPECKAEEFFLTSWAVGDPGMWVDVPANGCIQLNPLQPDVVPPRPNGLMCPDGVTHSGVKASVALFPDNPSNVSHAYIHDHFKFRNIHAGPFEHHIFHLHGNQWVLNPKSDKANYMDMQQIGPGGSYTMDITNEGAGNRNAYPGDAIYHCHFYPHFAQGMWSSLRIHDVMEEGTELVDKYPGRPAWALRDSPPAVGARAYPDGEVQVTAAGCFGMCDGTPVPGLVPMPLYPMAPAPAKAELDPADPRRIVVTPNPLTGETNPGFPFYIPGVAGHRPPSPPLDIACAAGDPLGTCTDYIDGGLPRHVIVAGTAHSVENRFDINKELVSVTAEQRLENPMIADVMGTGADAGIVVNPERASMEFHSVRCHDTYFPNGADAFCDDALNRTGGQKYFGGFITNGLPPKPGAPHSDPCVDNMGNPIRVGQASVWNSKDCAVSRTGCDPGPGFKLKVPTTDLGGFDNANPRPYKIANIQIDLVLNKKGWHFPQQRIISLWGDVANQYAGLLPPAPMVFRLNTLDCAEVWHANLVPNYYELDDFQVRTPTDIIAQHSHMTKFDMASSDGAANLWNYEDGTMSPGEIVERIDAINNINEGGQWIPVNVQGAPLFTGAAKVHPYFETAVATNGASLPYQLVTAAGCSGKTCGARTTIQRWLADPVLDNNGKDRGIGNVFTHDHFGPSTFQQLGLYATILAEPAGSTWKHNETGALLATRTTGGVQSLTADGGPTSWQAQIIPPAGSFIYDPTPYREFYFENSDFQQAYKRTFENTIVGGVKKITTITSESFLAAISRPSRDGAFPQLYVFNQDCPGNGAAGVGTGVISPCPMAIGGADQGTQVINYRSEPVGARIFNPDPAVLGQAAGVQGDLSFAFGSIVRADPELNRLMQSYVRNTTQCPSCRALPGDGTCAKNDFFCNSANFSLNLPYPTAEGIGPEIINVAATQLSLDVGTFDPATPMMRIYEGDRVKIRMQVGATEESHHFSMHGVKWLRNYADPESGWKNHQSMGISEQFQFDFPVLGDLLNPTGRAVDYLYSSNMSESGLWDGDWGLMRVYAANRRDLAPLPDNPMGAAPAVVANRANFVGVCPAIPATRGRPAQILNLKQFDVTAVMAKDVLPKVTGIDNPLVGCLVNGVNNCGTLVFNSRTDAAATVEIKADPENPANTITIPGGNGPIHDPTAILYVNTADIDPATGKLKAGVPVEPLIIRANAGACIQVTLRNRLPVAVPDLPGVTFAYEPVIDKCPNTGCPNTGLVQKFTFNANDVHPSENVGIHGQLVMYDTQTSDALNVGQNVANPQGAVVAARVQTVPPGGVRTYTYYAGDFITQKLAAQAGTPRVNVIARPIEFGVTGLSPSDKLEQAHKGMVGALVIEPKDTTSVTTGASRAQATVTSTTAGTYREFVAVTTTASNAYFATGGVAGTVFDGQTFQPVAGFPTEQPEIGVVDDAEDAGLKAVNYKSEPYWFRLHFPPGLPISGCANCQQDKDTTALYSNSITNNVDPETPVFTATAGDAIRFYFVEPAGSQRSAVPVIHGHAWQMIPYQSVAAPSDTIGVNAFSQTMGNQEGYGPAGHWNFVPNPNEVRAGGVPGYTLSGDYLYRMQNPQHGYHGSWGIFRVQ